MLKSVLLGLAGLVGAILLVGWLVIHASLPKTQGEVTIPGLKGEVTIAMDLWQRPYVRADSFGDALSAQGWLHASNRLWQMELFRRAGSGRMSELLGKSMLETDRELWTVGVPQLAKVLEANASDAVLGLVDQYLLGVNRAIDDYVVLPPEFLLLGAERPQWKREDVFAIGALMAFQSANNMSNELVRLALRDQLTADQFRVFLVDDSDQPDYPFVAASSGQALADEMANLDLLDPKVNPLMPTLGFGSNGWVVRADKSATGAPLYAFDSHDDLGMANLFYEVHLFFADRQLRGWSVAGLPGVINGYNESIAWGFTNIGDTQDLFLEKVNPDDNTQFEMDGEWYLAEVERVEIPLGGGITEPFEILHTKNGPLVSVDPPLSLSWAVKRADKPSLDSMFEFNLASNWAEFNEAMDGFPAPTLNATYADVHGDIGFRIGGILPLRGAGQGLYPLDGSKSNNGWQGVVSPQDMPRRANPETGFLAAANARVNPAGEGPLVSADNASPYRIQRIKQVLSAKDSVTLQDMRELQMDWMDGQAQMVLPQLLEDIRRDDLEGEALSGLALLTEWSSNPISNRDSAAALIFQQFYLSLIHEVFAEPTGEVFLRLLRRTYLLNQALDHMILHDPDSVWWRGDKAGRVTSAFGSAMTELAKDLGNEPQTWRLDDKMEVHVRHELGKAVPELAWYFNAQPSAWGGGPASVGRARYSYAKPYFISAAATVRAVASMANTGIEMSAVFPGGQAGHPSSEHYADQFQGWLNGELFPITSTPERVSGETITLLP